MCPLWFSRCAYSDSWKCLLWLFRCASSDSWDMLPLLVETCHLWVLRCIPNLIFWMIQMCLFRFLRCASSESSLWKNFFPVSLRWEFIKETKKVRKQENKETRARPRKWSSSWSSSCFLIFFYKFPPLIVSVCVSAILKLVV